MAINLKKFAKSTVVKKETTPTLELPYSDELKAAFLSVIEQKKIEKSAEAIRKASEKKIRPVADEAREQHCSRTGEFCSSVKIKVADVGPITYINQQRYSDMKLEDEEELRKLFGDEFELCLKVHTSVSLTDKGLKEAEKEGEGGFLAKIIAACGGEEAFAELFEVEQHIKPTEYFHQQKIMNPKIAALAKKASDVGFCKQASSSFLI